MSSPLSPSSALSYARVAGAAELKQREEATLVMKGKRAIVTAASSGIGKAAVIKLSQLGATVVLISRQQDVLDSIVARELKTPGFAVAADFSSVANVAPAIEAALKLLSGQLDILVNAVGGPPTNLAPNASPMEKMRAVMEFNFFTAEAATEAALPALKASRGCVVNVSSVTGLRPNLGMTEYGVAKAALNAATQSHALTYAKAGVRFNAVLPGVTETPLWGSNKALMNTLAGRQPTGKAVAPEEVAETIAFLASPSLPSLTGQLLCVDGGNTLPSTLFQASAN
jgi:NAD(P)-dependent dehydrogenase (short-subunit alcohol dehydrogenase family)